MWVSELGIVGLVVLINVCIVNNMVVIIVSGGVVKELVEYNGVIVKCFVSLLDIFLCIM